MPQINTQDVLSLSAPAILIVWTLREVFSYLLKTQAQKKETQNDVSFEFKSVLNSLSMNIQKQTDVLQDIHLELRENSCRIENLAKDISQIPKH